MNRNFTTLKAYHRTHREEFPEHLSLRVHRALSWLQKAEASADDVDANFIFLWISFNAAYANDPARLGQLNERDKIAGFFEKLCELDTDGSLYGAVWNNFSGDVRLLLENRYVFQPFWEFHNGESGMADWEERFGRFKRKAHLALGSQQTALLLQLMFSSLYTLRNQLVHGGATWGSSVNRAQLKNGVAILSELTPIMIDIMMHNPNTLWGEAYYPVITG